MRPFASLPRLLSLALLGSALLGCAPLQQHPAKNKLIDLTGPPPDVVVIAISGRCTQPCRAPRDNYDYLTSRGTLDAVADAISAEGFTVQVAGYADNAAPLYQPLKVMEQQRGFGALLQDFSAMKAAWFGQPHQPRVVLLGHSHGSVWLHHFARINAYVPFALQIDLDASCASWQLDHGAGLREAHLDGKGQPLAIDACDTVSIPGMRRGVPAKDVVWPNVALNLEVQSKRLPARSSPSGGLWVNYTFDMTPNVRPDGQRGGIDTYISPREDHSAVAYPNSDALHWVLGHVTEIARAWKVADEPGVLSPRDPLP